MQYRNSKMYVPTDKGSLSVHGTSYVEVNSDRARLNVRVSSENESLEEAQDKNSEISKRVLSSLSDYGIDKENIHSEDLSVTRNYDYNTNTLTSYKVTQLITILIDDFSKIDDVCSLVIENGANDDISIDFILFNPNHYYNKTLKRATQDALNKANILAKNFGVKYNPIPYKIVETSSPLYSITYYSSSITYAQGISPGLVNVTAEIEATFSTYPY